MALSVALLGLASPAAGVLPVVGLGGAAAAGGGGDGGDGDGLMLETLMFVSFR
jgi:hypothetical protein